MGQFVADASSGLSLTPSQETKESYSVPQNNINVFWNYISFKNNVF
jgi:hypothetical protein